MRQPSDRLCTILGMGPSVDGWRELLRSHLDHAPAYPGHVFVLAQDPEFYPWATHLFEMHDESILDPIRDEDYREERLAKAHTTLYMQSRNPRYPLSEEYPLVDVMETVGRDYFESSIAYMLGLAIHWEYPEISLYGVDLHRQDLVHQRANLEWMIGIAEEKGLLVTIPPGSALLRHRPAGYNAIYPRRYGWT